MVRLEDKTYKRKVIEEQRKEWDVELKLYGINTTVDEILSYMVNDPENTVVIDDNLMFPIRKVFTNSRETIKIVIAGEFCLVANRLITASGISHLSVKWYTGNESRPFFDELKEGTYIIIGNYNDTLLAITDCKDMVDAQKFKKACEDTDEVFRKATAYYEMSKINRHECAPIFTLQALEDYLKLCKDTYAQALKDEQTDLDLKRNNIKTNVKVSNLPNGTQVTVKALDDHKYTIKVDGEERIFSPDDYTTEVWRSRYSRDDPDWLKSIKDGAGLLPDFLTLAQGYMKTHAIWFSVDDKQPVKLEYRLMKTTPDRPVYNTYLNDTRIRGETLFLLLKSYFLENKELELVEEKMGEEITSQKTRLTILEQRLVTEGIQGHLYDLEGHTPIAFGVEKKGKKWYLVVGGKKLHIEGGLTALKTLETVISGKALRYEQRNSTPELVKRLSAIVGEKKAIDLVREAKDFAKVFSMTGGEK